MALIKFGYQNRRRARRFEAKVMARCYSNSARFAVRCAKNAIIRLLDTAFDANDVRILVVAGIDDGRAVYPLCQQIRQHGLV